MKRETDMVPGNKSSVTILDAGVDWLTLVSPLQAEMHDLTLNSWYETFNRVKHRSGLVDEANILGYAGIRTEGMLVGTRYDGAMVKVSGKTAKDVFLNLPHNGCNVTRLDVQVTVTWEGTGLHPCRLAALHATSANEILPVSRQRNIEEHKDNRGGYTTYIGSRQSTSFARVYNKSAQDADAYGPNAYRYEVQFNKGPAEQVLLALKEHQEALESACIALVWDWFERRGIIPVFRRGGQAVDVSRETIPLTELDKKLQWLYNQVRPTVAALSDQGMGEEVLVSLFGREMGYHMALFLQQRRLRTIAQPPQPEQRQASRGEDA